MDVMALFAKFECVFVFEFEAEGSERIRFWPVLD